MRVGRLLIVLMAGAVLAVCLSSNSLAVVYLAGYNAPNKWDNPDSIPSGMYGIKSDVYLPNRAPASNHPNTITACVALHNPSSSGFAWYARSGWRVPYNTSTARSFWEGLDSNQNAIGGVSTYALTRGNWYPYQAKKAGSSSYYAYVFWGSIVKSYGCYMGTLGVTIATAQIRTGGSDNDICSKWDNCKVLWTFDPAVWNGIVYFPGHVALSPMYGGGVLTESYGPNNDEVQAWNTIYGQAN